MFDDRRLLASLSHTIQQHFECITGHTWGNECATERLAPAQFAEVLKMEHVGQLIKYRGFSALTQYSNRQM